MQFVFSFFGSSALLFCSVSFVCVVCNGHLEYFVEVILCRKLLQCTIIISSYHHITIFMYHHTTLSSYHHTIISSYHHITISPHHRFIISSYDHIITSSHNHISISSFHHHINYIIRILQSFKHTIKVPKFQNFTRHFLANSADRPEICATVGGIMH